MTIRAKLPVAAVLAISAAYVGCWAGFAPRSFDDTFPGLGHHWVTGSVVALGGTLVLAVLLLGPEAKS